MFNTFHENFFENSQCKQLITFAENLNFQHAKVNVYGTTKFLTNIRNNTKVEFTAPDLAIKIQSLLLQHNILPLTYNNLIFHYIGHYFRLYKYNETQFFKPHKDGKIVNNQSISQLTILLYLNSTQGGETILMPSGFKNKNDWQYITPKEGSILIFDHNIWHEGKPPISGLKYVLRTDAYYYNH